MWRLPMDQAPPLQREGRLLMKHRRFTEAAAAFAAQVQRDEAAVLSKANGHAPAPSQGDVSVEPCAWPYAAVAVSTRLLLSKAQSACGDDGLALENARRAVDDIRRGQGVAIPLDGAMMCKALVNLAQFHLAGEAAEGFREGITVCKELRQKRTVLVAPAEHAQFCEIQAHLHRRLCRCSDASPLAGAPPANDTASRQAGPGVPPVAGCDCGSLAEALRCMEACVEAQESPLRGKGCGAPNKLHVKRKGEVRDLQLRLGLIDLAAEAAAAAEAEAAAIAKARERVDGRGSKGSRKRARFAASLDTQLAGLRREVDQRHTTLEGLCRGLPGVADASNSRDAPGSARMDWASVPAELRPSSTKDGGLGQSGGDRVQRKEWQLESLFKVLESAIGCLAERSLSEPPRPLHIVDFGSGSGNSALPFAALLPGHRFTLLDAKATCVRLGRKRSQSCGLDNVTWFHGRVEAFREPFDIGLATHLCGEATDLAQEQCLRQQAVFILTPCCLGKIKHVLGEEAGAPASPGPGTGIDGGGPLLTGVAVCETDAAVTRDDQTSPGPAAMAKSALQYPRSQWLRERMGVDDYLRLVRLSDYTQPERASASQVASKRLMDTDRLVFAAEAGYETVAGKLWPVHASPKHDVLVGAPARVGLISILRRRHP